MTARPTIAAVTCLAVLVSGVCLCLPAVADPAAESGGRSSSTAAQDGRHDFDFEVGHWKAHVRTLVHRLSHSDDWDELSGTVVTRALPMLEGWNESEMRVDSPTTHKHIELLAVRLYNPTTRQWAIYGSSIKTGAFDPPMIGQFHDGRGELYSQDTWEGRAIYVRFIWQSLGPDKTHLEQAFSDDGGKTWETNWIYDGQRIPDPR